MFHGLAPFYLDRQIRVADVPGRRRLRSSTSCQLLTSTHRLSTVGERSFHVAAHILWKFLPADVQSSSIDARLSNHTSKHNLLPVFQLSYRPFHSTETAVICVVDSMLKAMDQGHVGALMLLDLSVAFDTVDHQILHDVMR
jgi:hypothetical protein